MTTTKTLFTEDDLLRMPDDERANAPARELYRRSGFTEHDRHLMTKWIET